jgi:hypothetical protein
LAAKDSIVPSRMRVAESTVAINHDTHRGVRPTRPLYER